MHSLVLLIALAVQLKERMAQQQKEQQQLKQEEILESMQNAERERQDKEQKVRVGLMLLYSVCAGC